MNIEDLKQLGIATTAIAGIVIVVKEFLKSIKNKDKQFISFITNQEKNFTKIVTNHIAHEIKATHALEKSNNRLSNMVEHLIKFLKEKQK